MLVLFILASICLSQDDGNPHNWDRKRRCDLFSYDPPCGPCEGYGGIPYGDKNEEITLTTCEIVNRPEEVDKSTLVRPVWANTFYSPVMYQVLIGQKHDPFCFQVFPGNSSIGDLCYSPQQGRQQYTMNDDVKGMAFDLNIYTPVGNITSNITHVGENMWVVNKMPAYMLSIHQCVCVHIREGGVGGTGVFPLNPEWVDLLIYMGREKIDVEYIGEDGKGVVLDHWGYGPHHVWTQPSSGSILRMWQPFNGLNVFPYGTTATNPDPYALQNTPPEMCKKSFWNGAWWRIGCADNGYPVDKPNEDEISIDDIVRAKTMVPGPDYKGKDFYDMSDKLNQMIKNLGAMTKECSEWSVEELQQLQADLYLMKHDHFNGIYEKNGDRRFMGNSNNNWERLNRLAEKHDLVHVHRDGHCHEAVMWFVHHLTKEAKDYVLSSFTYIPLLAYEQYAVPEGACAEAQEVYAEYEQKVSCADCHSDWTVNSAKVTARL